MFPIIVKMLLAYLFTTYVGSLYVTVTLAQNGEQYISSHLTHQSAVVSSSLVQNHLLLQQTE